MTKIILLVTGMIFSLPLFAASGADIYLGASYNRVSIDFANADVDDSDGIGIVFGIDFGENLAFEAEYINSGKADMVYNVGSIESAKIQLQSLGIYGVFRTTGRVYFKGRVGVVGNLVDITDVKCSGSLCINSLFDDDVGLALGAGGGIRITDAIKLEAEYKLVNSDIDIYSMGLIYAF